MSKLNLISRKELIRKLKVLKFSGPYSGDRHQYMEREKEKIFIPNPHNKDIGIPILRQIIKQLNISKKSFNEL